MPEQLMLIPEARSLSGGADIDPTGSYRYDLRRSWGEDCFDVVNFIMLNPSTANVSEDDPTIRRCLAFAKRWGFGGLVVTNLFAFRATNPKALAGCIDPVGPLNDEYIGQRADGANLVVCAWGTNGSFKGRDLEVLYDLRKRGIVPHALKLTGKGHPGHPLYLLNTSRPFPMGEHVDA